MRKRNRKRNIKYTCFYKNREVIKEILICNKIYQYAN